MDYSSVEKIASVYEAALSKEAWTRQEFETPSAADAQRARRLAKKLEHAAFKLPGTASGRPGSEARRLKAMASGLRHAESKSAVQRALSLRG